MGKRNNPLTEIALGAQLLFILCFFGPDIFFAVIASLLCGLVSSFLVVFITDPYWCGYESTKYTENENTSIDDKSMEIDPNNEKNVITDNK